MATRMTWRRKIVNGSLALLAGSALLLGSTGHAQTSGGEGVVVSPSHLTERPIVLWPSEASPDRNVSPREGWTLPPQGESGTRHWTLPSTWPPPAGWSPSALRPSPPDWPAPDGWPPEEDWQEVARHAVLIPLVQAGRTVLAVGLTYVGAVGFCWYDRPYTEGAIRNGQRCVCESYLRLIRICKLAEAEPG